MQENTDQKKLRTWTLFHAVYFYRHHGIALLAQLFKYKSILNVAAYISFMNSRKAYCYCEFCIDISYYP